METQAVTWVVDTNILVYFILRSEPYYKRSRLFLELENELIAPDIWRPEFLNAIWLALGSDALGRQEAFGYVPLVANMITRTVSSDRLWTDALHLAIEAGRPPYDTLFVALAQREETSLVTFDQGILELFPRLAKRPDDIL